jgi:hypothetical protein
MYYKGREGQSVQPSVVKRNKNKTYLLLKKWLQDIEQNTQKNSRLRKKMINRTLAMVGSIFYAATLLQPLDSSDKAQLQEIDVLLKENAPDVYEQLNNRAGSFTKIKYIALWRQKHKVLGEMWWYKLLLSILSLVKTY